MFLCQNCIYRFILSVLNFHAICVRKNKTPEQSASKQSIYNTVSQADFSVIKNTIQI